MSASFFLNSNFSYHNMTSSSLRGIPGTINVHQIIKTKESVFQNPQVKVFKKVNTTRVGAIDRRKLHPSARTSLLKPTMMLDQKIHNPSMVSNLGSGKMVDRFVFRENFNIRTYEIGPDRTLSIETLMNYLQVNMATLYFNGTIYYIVATWHFICLYVYWYVRALNLLTISKLDSQETAVNHMNAIGLLGDGLGLTPEMCKKNLISVMAKMQVVVDRYPIWYHVLFFSMHVVYSFYQSL